MDIGPELELAVFEVAILMRTLTEFIQVSLTEMSTKHIKDRRERLRAFADNVDQHAKTMFNRHQAYTDNWEDAYDDAERAQKAGKSKDYKHYRDESEHWIQRKHLAGKKMNDYQRLASDARKKAAGASNRAAYRAKTSRSETPK